MLIILFISSKSSIFKGPINFLITTNLLFNKILSGIPYIPKLTDCFPFTSLTSNHMDFLSLLKILMRLPFYL